MTTPCVHFVLSPHASVIGRLHQDTRVARASLVWGTPDFIHPEWDLKAVSEIIPEDTVVFFDDDEADLPPPRFYPLFKRGRK